MVFSAGITSTVPMPRETFPIVPTAGTGLAGGFCASAVAVIANSERLRSEKSLPENRDHTDWGHLVLILYSSVVIKACVGGTGDAMSPAPTPS